jgi:RimJ/RimL family protein N-acetyltransferase
MDKNSALKNRYFELHPRYRELEVQNYPDQAMRIRLVEPDIAHAAASKKWLQNKQVGQFMGAEFSSYSEAELQQKITLDSEERRLQNILAAENEIHWCIELAGKIIGNVSLNSIRERSAENRCKAANIAILIGDPNFWNKGIAQYVNAAVLNWAFNEANFTLIIARIRDQNIASQKTFTKLGFAPKEIETDHREIWNICQLTKTHWEALKRSFSK